MKLKTLVCGSFAAALIGAGSVPNWLVLHPGVRAFTGDDGGDATMATICPALKLYLKESDNAAAPRCLHKRAGAPVVINAIAGRTCVDFESQAHVPCVRLRSVDGSWSGYTGATTVVPAVPEGTVLTLAPQAGEHLTLASTAASAPETGRDLGTKARARVLRYVPSADTRELYVRILDGSHAGAIGWVYAHTATVGGLAVTQFRF